MTNQRLTMKYTDQDEFKKTQDLINEMNNDGAVARFQGACLPASEVIQAILHSRGVKARLVECTALVVNGPTNGNSIEFIGFDTLVPLQPNETDTHMVVLVEAEQPFIVDASIGYKMGSHKYVVMAPLNATDPDVIAEAGFKGATVTYRVKKNLRYYNVHQKTLAERLETERKTQEQLGFLSQFVKILTAVSVFNMLANTLLIALKVYL
jgi:hypothetical protein